MKVKAKFSAGKFGFYGDKRRYNGEQFDIDPKDFSKEWMEKVEQPKKPSASTAKEGGE